MVSLSNLHICSERPANRLTGNVFRKE